MSEGLCQEPESVCSHVRRSVPSAGLGLIWCQDQSCCAVPVVNKSQVGRSCPVAPATMHALATYFSAETLVVKGHGQKQRDPLPKIARKRERVLSQIRATGQ